MRRSPYFVLLFLVVLVLTAGGASSWAQGQISQPEVNVLPVQGNVYMLVGAGSNIAVQTGPDGVVVVDSGIASMSDEVLAAIERLTDRPIRLIINTHLHPDHMGGNETLAARGRSLLGGGTITGRLSESSATILAQENVQLRLYTEADPTEPPGAGWPTDTYIGPAKEYFVNGEAIQVFYVPDAHTDGDSLVYFRRSDVVVAGDLFVTTSYPVIDTDRGGTFDGFLEGLSRILDITVPEEKQEGGTYVIPGHGRLTDEAHVHEYRDLATIVRDRVRDMVSRGMTFDQIKAANTSLDYDGRYPDTGFWTRDMFLNAVYQSVVGP